MSHTGRDINGFPFGAGGDMNIDSGQIFLGSDLNILGGLTAGTATVFPDIIRAFKAAFKISDFTLTALR